MEDFHNRPRKDRKKTAVFGRYFFVLCFGFAAAEIEPLTADILYDLAVIQEKNNHIDEAIKTYGKLLEIEPTSENGRYNRGRLKLSQNNFDGAIVDFQKTLELKNSYVASLNEIARQEGNIDTLPTPKGGGFCYQQSTLQN